MKKSKNDLIEILKIVLSFAGIFIFVICAIFVGIYRFKNPQLTETEIMIYSLKKYWWADLWFIISYFYIQIF